MVVDVVPSIGAWRGCPVDFDPLPWAFDLFVAGLFTVERYLAGEAHSRSEFQHLDFGALKVG